MGREHLNQDLGCNDYSMEDERGPRGSKEHPISYEVWSETQRHGRSRNSVPPIRFPSLGTTILLVLGHHVYWDAVRTITVFSASQSDQHLSD